MGKPRKNTPKAGKLMGSMRAIGYSFEAAIADILDNSISANSNEIHLFFPTEASQDPYISILDDGHGMDDEELFSAMCYGSSSCEDDRDEGDLGRFGLGMKAASLSQCRILTVASKRKDGNISAYSWDYNKIQGHDDWLVEELYDFEIEGLPHIEDLKQQSQGTIVVWQDFDTIRKSSNGLVYTTLSEYKGKLISYVGLIFHRFISSNRPQDKISIYINKHKIEGLDPFLEKHPKTAHRREFELIIEDKNGTEQSIQVAPFVIPYAKDLTDRDLKKLGGIENMRVKQGFYIYRNKRLIIWGSWFGVQKSELTKNARIRVDIPNSLDDIWGIDIKKQTATIPSRIQNQLKRAVEDVMSIAVKQQTYRGRRDNADSKINYVWNRITGRDENHHYYEINRETDLFKFVKSKISDEAYHYVEMLLSEIEKNVPYQQIYIDTANHSIQDDDIDEFTASAKEKALILLDDCVELGLDVRDTIEHLFTTDETLNKIPALKEELLKHYSADETK